jgi:hypothetical protein
MTSKQLIETLIKDVPQLLSNTEPYEWLAPNPHGSDDGYLRAWAAGVTSMHSMRSGLIFTFSEGP